MKPTWRRSESTSVSATERLAALAGGTVDRIDGVGHASYYSPAVIAAYILGHSADTRPETSSG